MVLHVKNGVKQFDRQLLDYLATGKNEEALAMLSSVDPRNLFDNSRKSLLHWTIHNCKVERGNAFMIKYFIDKGCNVDAQDRYGNTPLLLAVKAYEDDQIDVIKALIEADANVYIPNKAGSSPIKCVFKKWSISDRDVLKLFLNRLQSQSGHDKQSLVNVLRYFKCPVYFAMLLGDVEITRMMLDRGCSVNAECQISGDTALHEAVRTSDLAHVKLLVERGADIYALGGILQTPLHCYDTANDTDENLELLRFLLARGTALYTSERLITPMLKLLRDGTRKTIRTLLQSDGIDLRAKDASGYTAMHNVCRINRSDAIRYFRGKDFDINAVDNNGNTALMIAVLNGHVSTIERLLEIGADPNVPNNRGETTIWYSIPWYPDDRNIFKDIIDLLTMYGVDAQYHAPQSRLSFLDKFDEEDDLEFMGSVIAQLAEMELRDKSTIKLPTYQSIEDDIRYQPYFELCKKKLEEMKSIAVYESITLFDLLNGISKRKLAGYARNEEFVAAYNRILTENLDSLPHYYSFVIKKRVTAAITMANLKEQAASAICKIIKLNQGHIIAEEIVDYLDIEDLKDLIEAV